MSTPRTTYERRESVERLSTEGIELTLALQVRTSHLGTSHEETTTWWTLSWRTRIRPGGPNRRFYMHEGAPWFIPARTALDMLEEMASLGGLDDSYLDSRLVDTVAMTHVSSEQSPANSGVVAEITMPTEQWGPDPFWLVIQESPEPKDPSWRWRKCLLVHRESGRATIRSLTTAEGYKPRKVLSPDRSWFLDNSMPDLSVQQARVMLKHLRNLVPS